MKVRKGFVSNSSSSSFVLFGWALPTKKMSGSDWDEQDFKLAQCNASTVTEGTHPKNHYLLGYMISGNCDSWMEDATLSFAEINEKTELIRKTFDIPAEMEVKVFTGTRSC